MKINKMKKILIALDYNPTAQKVAELGFSMAKAMCAEVILLHVVSNPAYYSSTEYSPIMGFTGMGTWPLLDSTDGLKNAAKDYLDKSKHHLGDETIKTLVKEGEFAESILIAAKDLHADIIVMGSHSRRRLDKIIMGSVTEKVLYHTSVPLFIVPTRQNK